jgi:endonuclease YncB( thermonuclease family)
VRELEPDFAAVVREDALLDDVRIDVPCERAARPLAAGRAIVGMEQRVEGASAERVSRPADDPAEAGIHVQQSALGVESNDRDRGLVDGETMPAGGARALTGQRLPPRGEVSSVVRPSETSNSAFPPAGVQKPVEHCGKEASAFTRGSTEGRRVRLEGDPETAARDRYGHTLGYAWLPDGELLNLEIIRQGYGFAYTKYPFSRMEEFRAAERVARQKGRGLWAEDGPGDEADGAGREEGPPSANWLADQASCISAEAA